MNYNQSVINLFSDFILQKFPKEKDTIIQVADCKNFYVVKGQTSYNQPLDLSDIINQFSNEFKDFLSGLTFTNIIDLIEYDCKIKPVTGLTYTYYNNENCSIVPNQKPNLIPDLITTSKFPHGYSLSQGRLFFYYGKKIVYNIPPTYPFRSLTLSISKNQEESFLVYNDYEEQYDETLRSAILDVFNFDMSEIGNKIKEANWSSESTNPLEDYQFLKRIDKELIII